MCPGQDQAKGNALYVDYDYFAANLSSSASDRGVLPATSRRTCALPSNNDVCRALAPGADPVLRLSIQVGIHSMACMYLGMCSGHTKFEPDIRVLNVELCWSRS